jgi:predicted hotdog family 3-hydroxylacyl-ACP dehydratase
MSEYPPISVLVPHQEPMVLLDRVLGWTPGLVECSMIVRHGMRFVEDGLLAAPFTIEHMAQAVATCVGYEAYLDGRGMRVGMIVACRTFSAHRPNMSVGDELVVRAKRDRGNEILSHFHCEVRSADHVVTSATLTLLHSEGLAESMSLPT